VALFSMKVCFIHTPGSERQRVNSGVKRIKRIIYHNNIIFSVCIIDSLCTNDYELSSLLVVT